METRKEKNQMLRGSKKISCDNILDFFKNDSCLNTWQSRAKCVLSKLDLDMIQQLTQRLFNPLREFTSVWLCYLLVL